jgi:DNA-binding MarR family transcriptional regulator
MNKAIDIQRLIEEVILTFRRLRIASAEIHGDGTPIAGQRGVLIDLARMGPQSVPAIARAHGVSRQHIQVLIDRFRSRGFVELCDNPAHQRSKLVQLTKKGNELVKEMREREDTALISLNLPKSPEQIRNAATVLCEFRKHLEDFPWSQWRKTKVSRRKEGRR